jgi:hypothetical protein
VADAVTIVAQAASAIGRQLNGLDPTDTGGDLHSLVGEGPMQDRGDLGAEVAQDGDQLVLARDGLQRAAALSDGATRVVDRFGLLDWQGFLDVLAEQGPELSMPGRTS